MKKQSAPTELWQTTYEWLKSTGNPVNKKYCRQEITTHTDYPALTSVADFLEAGSMEYTAAKADASYIHQFNYPVLAHIKMPGQEYLQIIASENDWHSQKDATQHWSGVVLFNEKNSRWKNAENDQHQKQAVINNIYLSIVFGALTIVYLGAVLGNPWQLQIFGLLSVVGLLISVLTIANELGVQSNIVKQVCGAVSKGGCDTVLKTRYAKGIAGYSTGDIATIYFFTQFIALIINSFHPQLYSFSLWASIIGLLVAGWSIYTQAVIIKQWCALCLGIVAILIIQAIMGLTSLLPFTALNFTNTTVLVFLSTASFVALAVWPLKHLLKKQQVQEQHLGELKKWKSDASLFLNQWEKEQEVGQDLWENELVLGNPNAPVQLIMACNPYCNPCAKEHIEVDNLLNQFPTKLQVVVRLLSNSDSKADKITIATNAILCNASVLSAPDKKQMLHDWFQLNNYETWVQKWPILKTDADIDNLMNLTNNWFNENNIAFTPTVFLNGKKLPGRYQIPDLAALLPQLSDVFHK